MDTTTYILMHRDIPAVKLLLNDDTGTIKQSKVINVNHAPICYKDNESLNNWWERRSIPKYQQNKEILLNGQTSLLYMIQNLGLSVIDNYWIKRPETNLSWDDINLYTHDFAEKDFSFTNTNSLNSFTPGSTTQGELQKRWAIINGIRYLIKGNLGPMYRQSINEVFATKLHEMQGMPHAAYELFDLPATLGSGVGCISKNFTTEDLEFIPAYDITGMGNKTNSTSIYQYYIDTCVMMGIDQKTMQDFMDYQIMSDFLLSNIDRHLLNFGVLRDPISLQFICPAPIFDTGNSMFFNTDYNEKTVFDIRVNSWYKTELQLLNQVQNPQILDLDKIPGEEYINDIYGKDKYSVVYLDNLKAGYLKKIEMIEALQKGYSLNWRSENFYGKQKTFIPEHDSLSCDNFVKD